MQGPSPISGIVATPLRPAQASVVLQRLDLAQTDNLGSQPLEDTSEEEGATGSPRRSPGEGDEGSQGSPRLGSPKRRLAVNMLGGVTAGTPDAEPGSASAREGAAGRRTTVVGEAEEDAPGKVPRKKRFGIF